MNFSKRWRVSSIDGRKHEIELVGGDFWSDVSEFIATTVPAIMKGDRQALDRVISDHVENRYTLR